MPTKPIKKGEKGKNMTRFLQKLRRHGAAAPRADARPRGDVRVLAALAATGALAIGVSACGGANDEASGSSGDSSGGTIDLVAYSTPETAYVERLQPGFQETEEGSGVTFKNSFGASGDQSRAVEAGLPADLVHLPLEPDMTRLVEAGLIAEDYKDTEYNGGTQNSVVVIGVRPGNPENINSWEDLVSGDIEVITPNPFTSGGARWNLMAAYGSQIAQGKSEDEALDFVAQILEHTPVQDASARDSLQTFIGGKGDAFLSYENEALGAIAAGEELEYFVPDETILIETQTAVTTEADDPEAAQAFIDWQLTDEGQRAWAESGYRPVNEKILADYEDEFPEPKELFTIEEFGGWEKVATEFFDPAEGSVAEIERNLGVATE
jgi:sulfate/thiosulfate transport system substrate-binding protein